MSVVLYHISPPNKSALEGCPPPINLKLAWSGIPTPLPVSGFPIVTIDVGVSLLAIPKPTALKVVSIFDLKSKNLNPLFVAGAVALPVEDTALIKTRF